MKVGFTGTRNGLTVAQMATLNFWLCSYPVLDEFHHGDCIGADDDAAKMIENIARGEDPGPPIKVVVHPPTDDSLRAFNTWYDEMREAKPYLERNRDIVNECDVLVACPGEATEQLRSGTWATVRAGRKAKKQIVVILPDGSRYV